MQVELTHRENLRIRYALLGEIDRITEALSKLGNGRETPGLKEMLTESLELTVEIVRKLEVVKNN